MAIPDYQKIMLPLLQLCSDGKEHSLRGAIDELGSQFGLRSEEMRELLPSGVQPIFYNRVGWAKTYMVKAGLLSVPRHGHFNITERGMSAVREKPDRIDVKYLGQFPGFIEFHPGVKQGPYPPEQGTMVKEYTPEEKLEYAYQQLRDELAKALLQKVKGCSAAFFERLVVELLVAMGYGGSRRDAGATVGGGGDGGIDGIIKEDRLGLDRIYIQAKRWEGVVGRPEIQKFVGALQGQRARKGVFITTSSFTKEARDYAGNLESKVVLLDGEQLAIFMIDFNVGVSNVASYEVRRVDTDYFSEDD